MSGGGTIQGTCQGSDNWNWSYSCPDKQIVSCSGGGSTVSSLDGSNSCYFQWNTQNAGTFASTSNGLIYATNGGTGG